MFPGRLRKVSAKSTRHDTQLTRSTILQRQLTMIGMLTSMLKGESRAGSEKGRGSEGGKRGEGGRRAGKDGGEMLTGRDRTSDPSRASEEGRRHLLDRH
jgi:hypothetical protein